MTTEQRDCAAEGCTRPRISGTKGVNPYCREHKAELARRYRNQKKGPEVREQRTCAQPECDQVIEWSSWTNPSQQFCTLQECENARRRTGRPDTAGQRIAAVKLTCSTCGQIKPNEEFYRVKGVPAHRCKDCQRDADRRQYNKNPERRREITRHSQRRARLRMIIYQGRPMTEADVEVEYRKQRGLCAICRRPFARQPDVDHDHVTEEFRGLLDRSCNIRLHDGADLAWYENAITYLGLRLERE